MEQDVIPFQVSQGMVILGGFTSEQDKRVYVWIRRPKNEAELERLYKAVYESVQWKSVIAPRLRHMLDRESIKVTRLNPTPKSPIQ
jgi:hypothetical protein